MPSPARQVREPGPGFSSGHRATAPALPQLRHPCRRLPARKGVAIPGNARCAACRPRLTAAQGTPGRAAGHRGPHSVMKLKSQSGRAALCRFALDLVLLKSAHRERAALPGAPMARRVGEGKAPQGWPAGMPASLSSGQDALSTNPVAHPRTRRAGCPQGAPSGWPFSWVTFSLATQRESNSAAAGRRKLLPLMLFAPNETRARASRASALLQRPRKEKSDSAAAGRRKALALEALRCQCVDRRKHRPRAGSYRWIRGLR